MGSSYDEYMDDYESSRTKPTTVTKGTVRVPVEFANQYAAIKTAQERNAHLDRPTDFAESMAQGHEISDLRRLIEAMLKANQERREVASE